MRSKKLCLLSFLLICGFEVPAAAQSIIPPAVPEPPPSADLPQIETIIPEAELKSAVPPLPPEADPQLRAPLESIEAFEQRLESPLEVEGVAPANDPELNTALPPLEGFDARAVEYAEPASDSEATLGFGHNVDDSVDGRTLLYRQGVLTLAADGAGVAGRPFVAPQNKASAADLASAMGTHSLYRTVGGTSRVPRKPAITYWGMTYRDFVGVMLLDLADAALSLEKGRARGKFDKPDRIRRAIVQVELTWLEQVSDLALAERLKQIVAGARGKSEEVPTPHCEDYSPAAVVDCLSAPAGQNFRTWKKKCEQLPEIGSEGSIIRSRPDLWWKGLGSDLDPFKRARAQAEASVELVRLEAPDQFLPTSHPRETRYRGALSDVLASQLVRSTTSMSHDRLPLVASADCALLLSPLSLDPQRSLFKTATRALTKP